MAWLIIRVCNDRRGKNTADILKCQSKLGTPHPQDVAALADKSGIEVNTDGGTPSLRQWPWSVVAYTSRRKEGIGRVGTHIHLPARPKRKTAS